MPSASGPWALRTGMSPPCGRACEPGARTIASIRPGRVSTTTLSRMPGDPQGVLDILGIDVQAVGQDDDVLGPAHQDQVARVVVAADVAGPVPAVGRECLGGRLRVVPVAREEGRPADLDLAVLGQPDLDRRDRPPDRPEAVVLLGRHRGHAALGGAVALHDDDAHLLPRLLELGRQEGGGADEQVQAAAEPLMDAPEDDPAGAIRQVAGDRPEPVEVGDLALGLDLALDGAPEEVEDLGHDEHRRHPVIADRLEDHPRIAAPHVQDVAADGQRIEQRGDLLHQVREGQERDEPVLLGRDHVVDRADGLADRPMGEHHALRIAGRAAREDDLEEILRLGARPGQDLGLPIGRERDARVALVGLRGERLDRRRGEALEAGIAGIRRIRARCRSPAGSRPPARRSARSRRAPSAGRGARPRPRPGSRRSRRRAARVSTATRSGAGRRASSRGLAGARRRSGSAGRARGSSSASSCRRPGAGRGPARSP